MRYLLVLLLLSLPLLAQANWTESDGHWSKDGISVTLPAGMQAEVRENRLAARGEKSYAQLMTISNRASADKFMETMVTGLEQKRGLKFDPPKTMKGPHAPLIVIRLAATETDGVATTTVVAFMGADEHWLGMFATEPSAGHAIADLIGKAVITP